MAVGSTDSTTTRSAESCGVLRPTPAPSRPVFSTATTGNYLDRRRAPAIAGDSGAVTRRRGRPRYYIDPATGRVVGQYSKPPLGQPLALQRPALAQLSVALQQPPPLGHRCHHLHVGRNRAVRDLARALVARARPDAPAGPPPPKWDVHLVCLNGTIGFFDSDIRPVVQLDVPRCRSTGVSVTMRWTLAWMAVAAGVVSAQDPVTTMQEDQLTLVEREVRSLAEAMPAEAYDFAPREGAFDGVRTFGEQVRHLATMIFMTAARVLEEPSPLRTGPAQQRARRCPIEDGGPGLLERGHCLRPPGRRVADDAESSGPRALRVRPDAPCGPSPSASSITASTTTARWWCTHA